MDLASQRNSIYFPHGSRALSQLTSPGASFSHYPHLPPSGATTSFPIIAIVVIGITATAFMLVSYYIFVIKCCLHWHRSDLVRRFSLSRQLEEPSAIYSQGPEPRGLEESVIRLIPVIQYKNEGNRELGERGCCECAVCLNEFQEDEKLRIVPNCSHVFHIDCIDVWLQNNANCPLCRSSISFTSQFLADQQLLTPRPSPPDPSPQDENLISGDEDFVVIDLGNDLDMDQDLQGRQEGANALELPTRPIYPSPRKLEQRIVQKKARKLQKVTSMGDECIDSRAKDDHFSVQPIRRSFSMDSSGGRQFYLAVQGDLLQQNGHVNEVSSIDVCGGGSGKAKRSLFSFGHGSRSRNAVLPVYMDP